MASQEEEAKDWSASGSKWRGSGCEWGNYEFTETKENNCASQEFDTFTGNVFCTESTQHHTAQHGQPQATPLDAPPPAEQSSCPSECRAIRGATRFASTDIQQFRSNHRQRR